MFRADEGSMLTIGDRILHPLIGTPKKVVETLTGTSLLTGITRVLKANLNAAIHLNSHSMR
jgi:hypothetical protein